VEEDRQGKEKRFYGFMARCARSGNARSPAETEDSPLNKKIYSSINILYYADSVLGQFLGDFRQLFGPFFGGFFGS
jgi:hypothetical protein